MLAETARARPDGGWSSHILTEIGHNHKTAQHILADRVSQVIDDKHYLSKCLYCNIIQCMLN